MLTQTLCDVLESEFVSLEAESPSEDDAFLATAEAKVRGANEPTYAQLKELHVAARGRLEELRGLPAESGPREEAQNECDLTERPRMERLMKILRTRERAALCISGGGIRSATFALGVLQGLSHHKLLKEFDYLSTVSGGGYIGSWISAWRTHDSIDRIEDTLARKPSKKLDGEAPQVEHLREYSNYLSPQVGLLSADGWTLAATILRNMFLNWLVLVPILAVALLVPRLALAITVALPVSAGWLFAILFVGSAAAVFALFHIGRSLPSLGSAAYTQKQYILWVLLPLCAAAAFMNTFWVGWYHSGRVVTLLQYISFGAILHLVGWIPAFEVARQKRAPNKRLPAAQVRVGFYSFALITGALAGWIAYAMADIFNPALHPARAVCSGFPVVMGIFFLATALFIGLTSRITNDEDREWWARSGGWIMIAACGWAAASVLVLGGPKLIAMLIAWGGRKAAAAGGLAGLASGALGSLAGMSSKTDSGKNDEKNVDPPKWPLAVLAKIAPIVFLLALLIGISALAEKILGALFVPGLLAVWRRLSFGANFRPDMAPYAVLLLMLFAAGLAALMASRINVNIFSLHAMYRGRLIRAYLGASNPKRSPNLFTGFDPADNPRMHRLAAGRPFHIVNMALNLVHGKRLAWQQRKAESFTASRLHCGSARVGYQSSLRYGDQEDGISLGTAMAISGAAASPNMGYHSSPLMTFLMTFFNARLGWWLANPGLPGEGHWHERGPKSALKSLISEALGNTDDENPYVYLSDGGHFENLAIYEMVLRRCDTIVVIDAGADPSYEFEDLANALRKIRVDLGVTIHFDKPLDMKPGIGRENVHCAIGYIGYECADGDGAKNGTLIYIKPVLEPTLSVDVDNYHSVHPDFPQQPTSDQFFDEAQFESYRRLGLETIDSICHENYPRKPMTLAQFVHEALGHSGLKSARAVC
jgi:hypothetical protein